MKNTKPYFKKNVNDSSYSVAGSALEGLMLLDSSAAISAAKSIVATPIKGKLVESVARVLMAAGDESSFDLIARAFDELPVGQSKFNLVRPFAEMLGDMQDTEKVKTGVDLIVEFRESIPAQYGVAPYINDLLNKVAEKKQGASAQAGSKEQADYIKTKTAGK